FGFVFKLESKRRVEGKRARFIRHPDAKVIEGLNGDHVCRSLLHCPASARLTPWAASASYSPKCRPNSTAIKYQPHLDPVSSFLCRDEVPGQPVFLQGGDPLLVGLGHIVEDKIIEIIAA